MVNGTIGVLFIKEQSTYIWFDIYCMFIFTSCYYSCFLLLWTCAGNLCELVYIYVDTIVIYYGDALMYHNYQKIVFH